MNTDYLKMAREAFTDSTTYFDSSIRGSIEASLRQFQGVHPTGSKYHSDAYRSRSRIFRPKTRTAIRKNEAIASEAFFSTADVVTITNDGEDSKEAQAGAEVLQQLLNYRLKKSIPWFLTLIGAYQDAQTTGVCMSYNYWKFDARKKIDKPCIELFPVENLRISPGAHWTDPINTSPYLVHLVPMYVKDVRARMENPDSTTGSARWKKCDEKDMLTAVTAYGDSTRLTRERNRSDSQSQPSTITDFSIVWVHRNIIEIDGEDKVFYTLGTTFLLSEPVALSKVWWHGRRPFTMGICAIETHKNYPDGIPGITRGIQEEINEVGNQRIDNVKFAMNKRYFVKRGSQVDLRSLTRNVPGSATMLNDPEKDVKVQETQDVTSSAYQEQDRLNLDFDDVSGSFSQSSINSNRKLNETVGGLQLLSNTTNQISSYQLRTFVETWVEPTLQQLVLLEQYYETDEVVMALAGKKAQVFKRFGIDMVTDSLLQQELTVSVNVGVGSTNPEDKINAFMKAMQNLRLLLEDGVLERYGMDVAEVIKELFGKLGYKEGSRFFTTEDEDPRLTSAKATIQQLQQELSQKVSPEMLQAQVRKIDAEIENLATKNRDIEAGAMEKRMRTFFASGQTAQMVAAVPGLAPLMDMLSQAVGYTPPETGGVDPNILAPAAPLAGVAQNSVKDPRTGTEFLPGMAGDTTPSTPATPATPADPASAGAGANLGIETLEADA